MVPRSTYNAQLLTRSTHSWGCKRIRIIRREEPVVAPTSRYFAVSYADASATVLPCLQEESERQY